MRTGDVRPCPDSCAWNGGCSLPVDLPGGEDSELHGGADRGDRARDGRLFLHAGAGSGKTRVLVERFVRAVCDDDVPVDRVLAITFTEKAAAELKTRIRRRFLDLGERERAREAEGAWVSTIHGFCARLLRTHPLTAGIDPEFRVLDEPAASRLAVDAFDPALEGFLRDATRGERIDLVASYTPDRLQGMVRTVYSRLRTRASARRGCRRSRRPSRATSARGSSGDARGARSSPAWT